MSVPPDEDYNDVLYMTDRRRTFIDSATNEILLMEWSTRDDGWIPAMQALNDWQAGKLRVYSPYDPADGSSGWPSMITMPGSFQWPYLLPHEEAEVRSVLSKPWIPDGQITVLREEEIGLMESYQEANRRGEDLMADADTIAYLDSIVRPVLLIEMVPELVTAAAAARPRAPAPVPRSRPQLAPATARATESRPRATATRESRSHPFPTHLVAAVLAHAASTATLCPITMEPVTTDTATVTSCGHIFQSTAIVQWLTDHDTCPECRAPCCI
jgi:hypothetical protein